jgi:KDO2-lipid IV(A) lauroyltransferase
MKYLKFLPFYILSILPLSFLFLISDFMFMMVYHLIKYRRTDVRSNLKNAFPDKTEIELIQIEKKFYKHFCDIAFESLKALTISKKTIAKRFQIKNKELIDGLYDQKKNIIVCTSHYGNWEWFSFLPLFTPYRILGFYQKLSNNYFEEFMLILRGRFGLSGVESNTGYKTMVKLQQEGTLTLTFITSDQSPKIKSTKHWLKFLNQETAFLVGASRIAKKLNQTVIYLTFRKLRRGKYEIEFISLEESPTQSKGEEIIDKYAEFLENTINEVPELWLWSHKRWKLTNPDETGI